MLPEGFLFDTDIKPTYVQRLTHRTSIRADITVSIESAYDDWAEQYDTNDNKTRDLDAVATIETLSKYAFDTVLELGCGTGKNTRWLLQKATRVIGVDFSRAMLDIARAKVTDKRVQFKREDLTKNWDIDHQSVDLVTSSLTLEHIENINHIFGQANRALVENGLLFISELHPYKQYGGSGARYTTQRSTVHLEVYTHHITDYVDSACINGFTLVELREWFDEKDKRGTPRLISFVFRKHAQKDALSPTK